MFLTASRIHDGRNWLPEGTVVQVSDDGTVIAIHGAEMAGQAAFYDGILAPGFVNAHCHLELSHMKGVIPEHTGLIPFLQQVMFKRNGFTDEEKQTARYAAYDALVHNGVVAVGDIANGTDTLDLRAQDRLHIHTFVEAIGFTDTRAQDRFDFSKQVHGAFAAQAGGKKIWRQTIVPHAPYSVSEALFRLIDKDEHSAVLSIHNQETAAEDQYYISKEGAVNDLLKSLNIDDSFFVPSGKSSLKTYIDWIAPQHTMLFVHNTFTGADDIEKVKNRGQQAFWCLCPNANLYIENRLPDVEMLMTAGAEICIGTDSLSSNHKLCVLSEIAALKKHLPQLRWETLLQWATYNGAKALHMQDTVGSIAPGLQPGIVQLTGLDSDAPAVKRVV
jgi:cytosine/adenosine deaminase-related metal-dependent hydrolase